MKSIPLCACLKLQLFEVSTDTSLLGGFSIFKSSFINLFYAPVE